MKNYEDMSIRELSIEVASRLCLDISQERIEMYVNMVLNLGEEDDGCIFVERDGNHESFCINNPSDIMPIVFDNGISLMPWGNRGNYWKAEECGESMLRAIVSDKNPLRAAAICFLKMKDAENEQVKRF